MPEAKLTSRLIYGGRAAGNSTNFSSSTFSSSSSSTHQKSRDNSHPRLQTIPDIFEDLMLADSLLVPYLHDENENNEENETLSLKSTTQQLNIQIDDDDDQLQTSDATQVPESHISPTTSMKEQHSHKEQTHQRTKRESSKTKTIPTSQYVVRNELFLDKLQRSDYNTILTCRAENHNATKPILNSVTLEINCKFCPNEI